MALNKAIEFGKENRKPYRGSKAFDYSCRNNGACAYCRDTRLANNNRRALKTREEGLEAYYNQKCVTPV